MTSNKLPKAVFVCLAAYPLFDNRAQADIGGMETRSVLFARALASSGLWETVFAVRNHGQRKDVYVDGVRLVIYDPFWKRVYDNVVRRFNKHKWRPVIFLDKRDVYLVFHIAAYTLMCLLPKCVISLFWKKLKPDVVCCFGNNQTSADVIADCYREGIKTVLCIASDDDLAADYKPGDRRLNDYGTPRWMAWYAVSTADYVMIQTEHQQRLLQQNFQRTGTLIHNPISVPADSRQHWPQRKAREFVLWIGRSDTFHKRPLLMPDVARACPDIPFMMIVNRTNREVYEQLQRESPENVTIVERVPHHQIVEYYRRARMLVSTSAYEGFPNTFLQAAVNGTPVASLSVDPENILAEKGCGLCATGDFGKFVEAVRGLWEDNSMADNYAETFFEYVFNHHRTESQIIQFEALLDQAVSESSPTVPPGCWHQPYTRYVSRVGGRNGKSAKPR